MRALFHRRIRFVDIVAGVRDFIFSVVLGIIGGFALATVLNLWGLQ